MKKKVVKTENFSTKKGGMRDTIRKSPHLLPLSFGIGVTGEVIVLDFMSFNAGSSEAFSSICLTKSMAEELLESLQKILSSSDEEEDEDKNSDE